MFRLSYKELLKLFGIASTTYRRWKNRIKKALQPVQQPGPKPVQPFDLEKVHAEMEKLKHRAKRSHGVGKLRAALRGALSRRDIDLLVAAARREAGEEKKAALFEVNWREPGTVWAMDVFEMKFFWLPGKVYFLTVQDLATGYKFPPLVTVKEPRGKAVAAHLGKLFTRFGKPLFLKLDNGGNLNHRAVKELLTDQFIVPLNSPTYYAQYNGAIEHTQGEFKEQIRQRCREQSSFSEIALMAELAAHDLNHFRRRKLGGKNSCLEFFEKPKTSYSKRKRKEVMQWISDLALDIMEKAGEKIIRSTAWRVACRKWLEENGLVSISKTQGVLPTFS